jgi:hypothetical protein
MAKIGVWDVKPPALVFSSQGWLAGVYWMKK